MSRVAARLGNGCIYKGESIHSGTSIVCGVRRYRVAGSDPAKAFTYHDIKHREKLEVEEWFL